MTKKELEQILNQLEKYDLVKEFVTKERLELWLKRLNKKQINNFINLDIDPNEVAIIGDAIIDCGILKSDKYIEIIKLLIELKKKNSYINFSYSWSYNIHLYEDLKSLLRLNVTEKNKGFITEIMSLLGEPSFINSMYHQEDLETIINAFNANNLSLNYLTDLAINTDSLKDPYHLANMQILAENPVAIDYLYILMTTEYIIKSKYYQSEIAALYASPSIIHAASLYTFMYNHFPSLYAFMHNGAINFISDLISEKIRNLINNRRANVIGQTVPDYLEKLNFINSLPKDKVALISYVMSNKYLIKSPFYDFDIDFLQKIEDIDLLIELCTLVTDLDFVTNPHHVVDLQIIKETKDPVTRKLLYRVATNTTNMYSENHVYDMAYIARYNFSEDKFKEYELISYYVLSAAGINSPNHIRDLEKIYNGEFVDLDIDKENDLSNEQKEVEELPKSFEEESFSEKLRLESKKTTDYINELRKNPNIFYKKRSLFTRRRTK